MTELERLAIELARTVLRAETRADGFGWVGSFAQDTRADGFAVAVDLAADVIREAERVGVTPSLLAL